MTAKDKLEKIMEKDVALVTDDFLNTRERFRMLGTLFLDEKERVELMDRISHRFFSVVHGAFLEAILTGIFRIAGPTSSGKGAGERRNLVLRSFLDPFYGEWDQKGEFEKTLGKLDEALKSLKEMRNKVITHKDETVARDMSAAGIPTYGQIRAVLEICEKAITILNAGIRSADLTLDHTGGLKGELFVLDMLRVGDELRRKDIDAGFAAIGSDETYESLEILKTPDFLKPKRS